MTSALTENPAVLEPMRTLTAIQREALLAVDFFRHQRRHTGYWLIGRKRFAGITIGALVEYGLVRRTANGLVVTTAGQLVIVKLKGRGL